MIRRFLGVLLLAPLLGALPAAAQVQLGDARSYSNTWSFTDITAAPAPLEFGQNAATGLRVAAILEAGTELTVAVELWEPARADWLKLTDCDFTIVTPGKFSLVMGTSEAAPMRGQADQTCPQLLTRRFRIFLFHGTSNPLTYRVGVALFPAAR